MTPQQSIYALLQTVRRSRRSGLGLLAGVSLPLLGKVAPVQAKKKKKVTLCSNGKTVKAPKKKAKQLLQQGAAKGACPAGCPSGQKPCDNRCIPAPNCCVTADCLEGVCDRGICIVEIIPRHCGNGGPCAVFLTHGILGTSLNGVAGADQFCQDIAATNPDLSGRLFKAWLSDSSSTAAERFTNTANAGPYFLIGNDSDGLIAPPKVAENFQDLTQCGQDGIQDCIKHPINRKVDGSADGVISPFAWTGTDTTGELGAATCSNWTNDGGQGQVGSTAATGNTWTALELRPCGTSLNALYCFEQATPDPL